MIDEEKQIEEMAAVIHDVAEAHHIIWCTELAKHLINKKGYRKASEVAREIFAEIEENMTDIRMGFATLRAIGKRHLAKIKEKYESEDEENGN